jgi:DNA (cytosine-5)-methyltransferase 1
MMETIRFIDLFAGIGGIRLGFEQAAKALGLETECVLTSEIKAPAIATYQQNFPQEVIQGDITQILAQDIPNFDFLLAGFPCQPFSSAGQRLGFLDTRGTLFFEIERILETKKPMGFLLENVEGLVAHDQGRTLKTILAVLERLGYQVTWKVLNALDFGVPQERKRIFILGHLHQAISLEFEALPLIRLGDLLEKNLPVLDSALPARFLRITNQRIYTARASKINVVAQITSTVGTWNSKAMSHLHKNACSRPCCENAENATGQSKKALSGWTECP